jgi:hypothetical protein
MKIIKLFTWTVVLIFITANAYSQSKFGLRQGAAVTTFSEKGDLLDNDHITGSYAASLFCDLSLSKSFVLQPEINYLRKGRNNETFELNTTIPTDYMVNYLQVPVLLQFRDARSMEKSGSYFFVNAGPYAAFALNNKTRTDNGLPISDANDTDWGATFGVGYQTPIFKQNIRFDLRYDMGLSQISNQPSDYRSKALSLTIGIVL